MPAARVDEFFYFVEAFDRLADALGDKRQAGRRIVADGHALRRNL
jgi:hypothetical protein